MNNPEIGEIVASVQAAISRAYTLGRLDALKHVITAMEAEETSVAGAKQLALLGPKPSEPELPSVATELTASEETSSHQDQPANDDRVGTSANEADRLPWYRRAAI